MTAADARDLDDRIEVMLPLQTRYASTLRVIAAALGADAGFSVDEIDDVRLGLNEVFSLLVEACPEGRVRTTFRLGAGELEARLEAVPGPATVAPDELALTILRSVVDRHELSPDGITLVKRASEAAGGTPP